MINFESKEFYTQFCTVKRHYHAFERTHGKGVSAFLDCLTAFYDIEKIVKAFPRVLRLAEKLGWHESRIDTLKTFCQLCFVDYVIVERYLGATLDELVGEYEKEGINL